MQDEQKCNNCKKIIWKLCPTVGLPHLPRCVWLPVVALKAEAPLAWSSSLRLELSLCPGWGRGEIFKIHLRDTFVQAGEGKIQLENSWMELKRLNVNSSQLCHNVQTRWDIFIHWIICSYLKCSRQISNVFSIHLNEEDEGGLCDFEQLPRLLARSERMSG